MKSLLLFIFALCINAKAQFPFDPATGQWLQTNALGGVNAGYYAGSATPNLDTIRLGFFAGAGNNFSGTSAVCIGRHAGYDSVADQSVMVGHAAGQYAGIGGGSASSAVIIGYLAGRNATMTTPQHAFLSVQIGNEAGTNTQFAQTGVMVGAWAGRNTTNAQGAVLLGFSAGYHATNAINSVFIGNQAGASFSRNNTLIIESHSGIAPAGVGALIYGEFDTRLIQFGASQMGFFGSPAITRPTLTGSRSDNSALTSLLQALHNLGLIDNQTTP